MFRWGRRSPSTQQAAEARAAAGGELARLYGSLAALFGELPGVTGTRVVAGIGPKGGSGKTTLMVSMAYLLAQVVTGDLILVDVNPDKSNVRERLIRAGQRGTLLELIDALGTLHYPTQLARFQVPVSRVKLIHKDGLRSVDVQQVPAAKWYELLETLSWYGQLVLADGGLSLVSPAATGALGRADHVLLAVDADPVVIQKTLEAVNEVMTGDPAVQGLLLGATVVVTYTNPTADLDPLLQESIDYLRRTFAGVFVVPYDPAAAVSGLIPFDRLTFSAQEAYLRIALHLAECFHRPPRVTQAPTAALDETPSALSGVPGGGGQFDDGVGAAGASPALVSADPESGLRGDAVLVSAVSDPKGRPADAVPAQPTAGMSG